MHATTSIDNQCVSCERILSFPEEDSLFFYQPIGDSPRAGLGRYDVSFSRYIGSM